MDGENEKKREEEEGKQPTARISTYHQLWIHKLMMVLEISAVG